MTMIYDFNAYRTPYLLRSFSRQSRCVSRQCGDFSNHIRRLGTGLRRIQEAYRTFCLQLDTHLTQLEKTRELARKCSAAWELNSIEEMIKKRDQIIRAMQNKVLN